MTFGLVGVLNTAVSFVVFQLCYVAFEAGGVTAGASPTAGIDMGSFRAAVATAIGYSAGVVNSFLLNRGWTFRVQARSAWQFPRFVIVNIAGLLLGSAAMFVLVDERGYAAVPVWFLTTAVVMVLNFLGSKYWVFAAR